MLKKTHPKTKSQLKTQLSVFQPSAAKIWVEQIDRIQPQSEKILNRIPKEQISALSGDFATKLISHNRSQLLYILPK